jgi:hypothetical protein
VSTQLAGATLVALLIAALLFREAINVGLVNLPAPYRRALDRWVVALGAGFAAVVAFHLVTL